MNKAQVYGMGFSLFGFVVYIMSYIDPILPTLPKWSLEFTTEFCKQVGMGLIVTGILSIILGLKDWQDYFRDRLKEIVLGKEYLGNLNESELNDIQLAALKAKYKGSEIDREDSFVSYLQNRIQHYIGKAYREGVVYVMNIQEHPTDPELWIAEDRLVFVCRKVGDDYVKDVKWLWEPYEIKDVTDAKLVIKCNYQFDECDNKECKNGCEKSREKVFDKKRLDEFRYAKENHKGFVIPLENLVTLHDGIRLELTTTHELYKSSLITWAMTNPSKDIDITINYPKEYIAREFIGGIEDVEYIKSSKPGMLTYSLKGWLLPRSGIAVKITKETSK